MDLKLKLVSLNRFKFADVAVPVVPDSESDAETVPDSVGDEKEEDFYVFFFSPSSSLLSPLPPP